MHRWRRDNSPKEESSNEYSHIRAAITSAGNQATAPGSPALTRHASQSGVHLKQPHRDHKEQEETNKGVVRFLDAITGTLRRPKNLQPVENVSSVGSSDVEQIHVRISDNTYTPTSSRVSVSSTHVVHFAVMIAYLRRVLHHRANPIPLIAVPSNQPTPFEAKGQLGPVLRRSPSSIMAVSLTWFLCSILRCSLIQ